MWLLSNTHDRRIKLAGVDMTTRPIGVFFYCYSALLLSHSNPPLAEFVGTNMKLSRHIREDNQIIETVLGNEYCFKS